ncbi:hypothetical protein BKA93DRAFT_602356 [Sparassis latifolia]
MPPPPLYSHSIINPQPVQVRPPRTLTSPKRFRKGPPLPLYHPLGHLALSLPELDPAAFGLPSSLTIDDGELANDAGRRASSRTRRPAPKVRDREGGGDDNDSVTSQANALQNVAAEQAVPRERSPRKRRGGGGSGGKRKRKEVDDGDGVYPPPAKRTRNPRGTGNATPSVTSPLVNGAVVAADAEGSSAGVSPPMEGAETEEGQAEAPPVRNTRSRRPRAAANRRRHSSASETTTTSVSVSIAANARVTRSGKAENRTPSQEAALEANNGLQKKEEEDEQQAAAAAPPTKTTYAASTSEEKDQDVKMKVPLVETVEASKATQIGEEREEGELSDDLDGNRFVART